MNGRKPAGCFKWNSPRHPTDFTQFIFVTSKEYIEEQREDFCSTSKLKKIKIKKSFKVPQKLI